MTYIPFGVRWEYWTALKVMTGRTSINSFSPDLTEHQFVYSGLEEPADNQHRAKKKNTILWNIFTNSYSHPHPYSHNLSSIYFHHINPVCYLWHIIMNAPALA